MAISTSLIVIVSASIIISASLGIYFVYQASLRSPILSKRTLRDAESLSSLCNDGSDPVYFINLNPQSTDWLIFLQGGGDCYNEASCKNRLEVSPRLMTSKQQPDQLTFDGFLGTNCSNNPEFCEANHVYLHYCSSDQWSGDYTANSEFWPWSTPKSSFNFHGSNIVTSVVSQIIKDYNDELKKATRITLTGPSAGGMGCVINGDRVGDLLNESLSDKKDGSVNFTYQVIPDSGWFLPGPSYRDYPCDNTYFCNIQKRVKVGVQLWNARANDNCQSYFGSSQKWKCFFLAIDGVIDSFKYPMMNVFYKYDVWQVIEDGIIESDPTKFTKQELQWIEKRGQQTVQAIEMLRKKDTKHGIFMADCVFHVLTFQNSQINSLKINGKTMSQAINAWLNDSNADSIYYENDCQGSSIECNSKCPHLNYYDSLVDYGRDLYPDLDK